MPNGTSLDQGFALAILIGIMCPGLLVLVVWTVHSQIFERELRWIAWAFRQIGLAILGGDGRLSRIE